MSDYTDRIGDRLDHPELVPESQRHLIADDVQRVRRILEWPVSGRVIDIGCSDGAITRRIAALPGVKEVIGIDKANLDHPFDDGPNYAWCPWDVVHEPYPYIQQSRAPWRNGFNVVYCCEVFEHLSLHEATLALRNICAVLKQGGDLIVTVPNRDCLSLYEETNRARWRFPDHWSIWDYDSLSDFLLPHFDHVEFKSLYDHERDDQSIWLLVRACGRL